MYPACAETVEYLSSAAMVAMETSYSVVIIWPFWFIFSTIFNIGMVTVVSQMICFFLPLLFYYSNDLLIFLFAFYLLQPIQSCTL